MPTSSSFSNLRGQLLVAMPSMEDPRFSGTLSLICEHNEEGALALVINQPLPFELPYVLKQVGIKPQGEFKNSTVFAGGPIAVDRGFVLHKNDQSTWRSSLEVSQDYCVTTSDDMIDALAKQCAPEGAQLVLGYSGWSAGQLEQEILENTWLTIAADPSVVFSPNVDQRLQQATKSAGIDYNRILGSAGHA